MGDTRRRTCTVAVRMERVVGSGEEIKAGETVAGVGGGKRREGGEGGGKKI